MAKRLVANGHEVTFVTTSASLSDSYTFAPGWNDLEIEGIKLKVLNLPYSNKDSYFNRILKFISFSIKSSIKSLSIEADVVLATSTPLTIVIPGVIYSKIKNKPMVFEVRDLWPELPIAIGALKNRFFIIIAKWLEKIAYKHSSHLIGLSPGMCEGIARHGIDESRITLATNSCDTDLFDVLPEVGQNYAMDNLKFLKGRKLIVYTGTFGAINNVKYIVELAKRAKEQEFKLCFLAIGDGMEKNDIIKYAEKVGVLNDNLYILDSIPKKEVVKLLSAADLSLSLFGPLKEMWHNSANKLFDALASNTPIAINYGGWQKDVIENHKCGLVLSQTNIDQAVNAINDFLHNEFQYKVAKDACHHLAYKVYSRDIMALRVEDALKSTLQTDVV